MLYKRPDSDHWQIRFTLQGVTVRESSGTPDRKAAERLEHTRRIEIWNRAKLGQSRAISWEEGIAEWNMRKASKRSLARDGQIFDLAGKMFAGKPLDHITDQGIAEYGRQLAEFTSPSNANRHLDHLRAFFNALVKWKLLSKAPGIERYNVPEYVPTILSREDYARLKSALPGHLVPLVEFAAGTGLRFSNVARMRWERSETDPYLDSATRSATVPPVAAKAGRVIHIPLSSAVWDTVNDLEKSPTGYVFVDHRGRGPIGSIKTAWHKATARAGLSALRFHDLRHAWASWHIQEGTPERYVQELGGWSTGAMVKRYSHLNVEHLRRFVK